MNIQKHILLLGIFFLFNLPNSFGQVNTGIQVYESRPAWQSLLLVEGVAFGLGILSRTEEGAYVSGGIYSAGGATLAGINLFSRQNTNTFPAFTIPYAAGMGMLAWYNFRYAALHSPNRKFWTNALGLNSVVAGSIALALIFRGDNSIGNLQSTSTNLHISYVGTAVKVNIFL